MGPIIFLAILAAAVACGIGVRRGLVTLQHDVAAAWSGVDDLLTQRHDRLPELFEASERHQPGKRDALARAGKARMAVFHATGRRDVAAAGAAEGLLRGSLGQLFAAAAGHPSPGPDESWQRLQAGIEQLGDLIGERCETYNGAVNMYNLRLARWPGRMIARLTGFSEATPIDFTSPLARDRETGSRAA